MDINETVTKRIEELIVRGNQLRQGNEIGQMVSGEHGQECKAWFAPAQHMIQTVCPSPENAYRKRSEEIIRDDYGLMIPTGVGALTDLLSNLLRDMELGLLSSVINRTRAETFDDFLDHADSYHRDGKKSESGVIAGVVFEDSIRRICDKYGIAQKGKKLDDLISEIVKADVISQTKAKRARVAAHVRTKATHAQWDEFDLNDVKVTIEFSRELISDKLDG